jgi:hypothetical protein
MNETSTTSTMFGVSVNRIRPRIVSAKHISGDTKSPNPRCHTFSLARQLVPTMVAWERHKLAQGYTWWEAVAAEAVAAALERW